jgi:hypothetical protein
MRQHRISGITKSHLTDMQCALKQSGQHQQKGKRQETYQESQEKEGRAAGR